MAFRIPSAKNTKEKGDRKASAEHQLIQILAQVPVFSMLNRRELRNVALIVHRREYRAGEHVFYQNDPGLGMYVIEKGEVLIKIIDENKNEKELVTLKAGDFFGELALLDESPRSAFAIAKTDCDLIGFFRPDLFELIEKNTNAGIKIVLKLAEFIGERLRATSREVSRLEAEVERLKAQLSRPHEPEALKAVRP
ncbi:MAG TPA: cyclic nucleotide-binding domain-containing protein [Bacteroidota bacterium]